MMRRYDVNEMVPDVIKQISPDSILLHAILLVTAVESDGTETLHVIVDSQSNLWSNIGMLEAALVQERRYIAAQWEPDDEGD